MPTAKYTLVQHSGVTTGHDEFAHGVEPRCVATVREQNAVTRVGGLLFDDYAQADLAADKAMYPEGATGLIPKAAGTFADVRVDGLAVYLPPVRKHEFVVSIEGCTDEQAELLMRHEFGSGGLPQRRELFIEDNRRVVVDIDWGWRSCS